MKTNQNVLINMKKYIKIIQLVSLKLLKLRSVSTKKTMLGLYYLIFTRQI